MSAAQFDVVCVGNAIVDVIAQADEEFLTDHDMVKGSMQLIDDERAHSLYADMGPAIEASGGSAANTAAGLASFGGTVGFIGKVADDLLGEVFTHDIGAIGVHFERRPAGAGTPATARCLIVVTPDGERTLNTYLGVSSLIGPGDVDEGLIGSGQVAYCEGYLWDLEEAKAAIVKTMDVAHAADRKVAFTLSDSFCVDRHRADFLELTEQRIDILFANEAEITSLYEVDTFDAAADRVSKHCEIACLTRSAKGSVVITSDGHRHEVAARPVDRVVDTTGAGDLYAAGFLHGYTRGLDLATCADLGGLGAAEVISHIGARPEVSLAQLAERSGAIGGGAS
jgi:sugar/nucleoside kinase (ribokinase family)